jgi:MYXO-CTERM domain-containing protein
VRSLIGALLLALLAAPAASACAVTPLMDLQFDGNPLCPRFEPEGCLPLPSDGESVRLDGTLRWEWDMPGCGDSALPRGPVTIRFVPLERNPSWLQMEADPPEIQVLPEHYLDPSVMQPDTTIGTMRFILEFPVSVTWTRVGSPSEGALLDIQEQGDQVPAFLRARSEESGDFRESTTVEQFLFDARALSAGAPASSQQAPAAPVLLALATLALAAAHRRRP